MSLLTLFVTTLLVTVVNGYDVQPRQLQEYQRLGGYLPRTDVADEAAIDLDQEKIERLLETEAVDQARQVYENGGNSKPYAVLRLIEPPGSITFEAGTHVYGLNENGEEVVGALMQTVNWEPDQEGVVLLVEYISEYDTGRFCKVGGLVSYDEERTSEGCFSGSGVVLLPKDEAESFDYSYQYFYDVEKDNRNGLTLQGFSTQSRELMRTCHGSRCDYYPDFKLFLHYYGQHDYGDRWIEAATYRNFTGFHGERGDADFAKLKYFEGVAGAMAKGTTLLNLWMQVVGEMENALETCERQGPCDANQANCHGEAIHALDEAVAFYVGSAEGADGSKKGYLLYNHADKLAADFRTAGTTGDQETGTAYVNLAIIRQFQSMQQVLRHGDCNAARHFKEAIVNWMKVPLVQGALLAAYIREYENFLDDKTEEMVQAEGAAHAAAILPYVYHCNKKDASLLYDNLKIGSQSDDTNFALVKKILERNYKCMGMSCSAVGGLWSGVDYKEDAEPCGSSSGGSDRNGGVVAILVLGMTFGSVTLFLYLIRYRRNRAIRRINERRYHSTHTNFAAAEMASSSMAPVMTPVNHISEIY